MRAQDKLSQFDATGGDSNGEEKVVLIEELAVLLGKRSIATNPGIEPLGSTEDIQKYLAIEDGSEVPDPDYGKVHAVTMVDIVKKMSGVTKVSFTDSALFMFAKCWGEKPAKYIETSGHLEKGWANLVEVVLCKETVTDAGDFDESAAKEFRLLLDIAGGQQPGASDKFQDCLLG